MDIVAAMQLLMLVLLLEVVILKYLLFLQRADRWDPVSLNRQLPGHPCNDALSSLQILCRNMVECRETLGGFLRHDDSHGI